MEKKEEQQAAVGGGGDATAADDAGKADEEEQEAPKVEQQVTQEASPPPPAAQMQREQQQPVAEASRGEEGGWGGGWGGWWTATSSLVSSVTETASKAANQLADQLNAALLEEVEEEGEKKEGGQQEGGDDPKSKGKEKVTDSDGDDEDHDGKDKEDQGFFDYISTVLQQQVEDAEKKATSVIESTMTSLNQFSLEQSVEMGQKWTMQSLDVLEAVGKKAIETLELDEKQIQQSIEQLALSEDVPGGEENAGKKASTPAAASPKPVVRNKVVTFESNFEDSYGKAHLEALEHLSASCLMIFYKANPQALKKLSGALKRIEQLFNEDEDEDEEEEERQLDAKLLRKLNRKARMKRKIIEKFVATAKQSAQQLIEEFAKQLSTLKAAEGQEGVEAKQKTPEEISAQTLAQLDHTSKVAMLRLSELSAASVELLLRVAESYLVGVTSPVAIHREDTPEQPVEGSDEGEDIGAEAPAQEEPAENADEGEDGGLSSTPALAATSLVKDLTQSLKDVTQAFLASITGIAKAGKGAMQALPPGEHDINKLSAKIDAKVKALKKEVEAKFGNSAVENVQETKKLFVNISKAVLVSGFPAQSAPAAVATASSPSPSSPSTERKAATEEEAVQPAAEETTVQEEEEPAAEKEVVEEAEQPSGEEKSDE
ncbi:uncharacterized protein ACA1_377450 [Acanthamoeba castellanii str. Neff]|uniref:Uncharacterized protein n=1 Tax=Acanthamoeba castellanii (strain ATCC 30010 / Neff) TaxID=1257118 RepID=L8GU74_ACACF|nr:uncharacterized protein ACA1_377450 [Acanthamoeba castellanii str. Neff]ELR15641.1 hypothetical protein ACA1_377450 [Acanthamoeba castellanii str. Neff]